MSDQRSFRLVHETARKMALATVEAAPHGWVVTVGPETRSVAQNAALWPRLAAVAKHQKHFGRDLIENDWKNLFMGALHSAEYVPTLDGRGVMPLGLSTRVLPKPEFGALLDLIDAYAAEHDIPDLRNIVPITAA